MTESAGRDPVFTAARAEREQREAAGLCLNQAALSSSGRCLFYVLKDRSHGMIGGSKEWHACFGKRPGCQDINAGGWGWGAQILDSGSGSQETSHRISHGSATCHQWHYHHLFTDEESQAQRS